MSDNGLEILGFVFHDGRGRVGYFDLASQLKLFDKLDQWIHFSIQAFADSDHLLLANYLSAERHIRCLARGR